MGGAREGRPRQSRILRMASADWMAARANAQSKAAHGAARLGTLQNVNREHATHELSPMYWMV